MATTLRPFYRDVQAHYDLSDQFYRLFLDPSMMYSCAYFRDERMSLAAAQQAKIDLSLNKCDLWPGMRLLDIGCGWGSTALRAARGFGVQAIGLTLSRNQRAEATRRAAGNAQVEIRLQGWEEFDEPVDRIVSIGALEHFRIERYGEFFQRCRRILPADGRMMVHSIVHGNKETLQPGFAEFDHELVLFMKFIAKEIFPGGQVPPREAVLEHAAEAGFQLVQLQSLRPHYARTLDCWAANLTRAREQALELVSPDVYERYMRYLTGCAHYFRTGHCDVVQFTFAK